MYAANIADLTAHAQTPESAIPLALLTRLIDPDPNHAVVCERGKAVGMGHGAPFLCNDDQAAAIIQVIRTRHKKYQWRFYQKSPKGWKRI